MQAFKLVIAAREERRRRMELGLDPQTERAQGRDSTDTTGGEGSQEERMNELAAEKRKRRLKEVRINPKCFYSVRGYRALT